MRFVYRLWRWYLQTFWSDFRVPRRKIDLFRLVFFVILAVDCWQQIAHAPRYGAGGFNVSHFPALMSWIPVPGREIMAILFCLQAYLALRIALGATEAAFTWCLTGLFGFTYFISQINSYQHHYLVFLILFLTNFVPWKQDRAPWAVRLIIVQLALVYVFAAVAKMEPGWWDGTALMSQVQSPFARAAVDRMFSTPLGGFAVLAKLILVAELALAALVFFYRRLPVAWVLGVSFHIAVELTGLQIGLFSYLMLGVYILLLPDRWVARVESYWNDLTNQEVNLVAALTSDTTRSLRLISIVAAVSGGFIAIALLPFSESLGMALVLAVACLIDCAYHWRQVLRWRLVAHLLASVLVLFLAQVSDTVIDYYRLAGGEARIVGDRETAQAMYSRLTEVRPNSASGYLGLADLATDAGDENAALSNFQRARALDPESVRATWGEAYVLARKGRVAEALEAARETLRIDPRHADAARLVHRLTTQQD